MKILKKITKKAVFAAFCLAFTQAQAGVDFDGTNTSFDPVSEYQSETYIILSGQDAKDLYHFLPAGEGLYIPGNNIDYPGASYIYNANNSLCFGGLIFDPSLPGSVGSIHGPEQGGYVCQDEFKNTSKYLVYTNPNGERGHYVNVLGCFLGKTSAEAYCKINVEFSRTNPEQPDLGIKIPLAFGLQSANNNLGKSLKGRSFSTSSGNFKLKCDTISANRYYDCFVTVYQ